MSIDISQFSLEGSHSLIIGASGGIGSGVAKCFARAGATVTLAGRNQESLSKVANSKDFVGVKSSISLMDITDESSVMNAFEEANQFQQLSIVVVCSGVSARHEIVSMPESEYRRILETNLTGSWNCARAAGQIMIPQKKGKLVLFGSLSSHFGLQYASIYAATKGAVVQLTKSLAIEWAEHNIQVNAVAPGFIETEMTKVSLSMPERKKWIMDRTPARRTGTPEEIANATLFLSSPASDFITGHVLYVDGGFMAGSQW